MIDGLQALGYIMMQPVSFWRKLGGKQEKRNEKEKKKRKKEGFFAPLWSLFAAVNNYSIYQ